MSRSGGQDTFGELLRQLAKSPMIRKHPYLSLLFLLIILSCIALAGYINKPPVESGEAGDYLFCFWNTENFFDNRINGWRREPDQSYDRWFAEEGVFEQKVKNLTEVLAPLNGGKGPDILALAEIESESRSAQALMESLNKAIKEDAPPYRNILIKNLRGGRDIVTAILTRLPVVADRTQLLDKRHRILEGHIKINGQDLTVLASHWTSRVSDEPGIGRAKYADLIYGRFRTQYKANADVSFLVCGDFNDNPDDVSVTEHLHATSDLDKVKASGDPPLLYDVFAPLWTKEQGTHFYRGRAYLFDHIVVSPGMVNGKGGWQCLTETAQIVKHRFVKQRGRDKGHPLSFGNENPKTPLNKRGVSDHLPVTVQLRVTTNHTN